jgi:hypothetical protein
VITIHPGNRIPPIPKQTGKLFAQLANTGFSSQGAFIARPFPAYANGDHPLQSVTFFGTKNIQS